ncbi:MAG: DNA polymerase III subunit gamma/tau [bacterium]
MNLYLKYRPKTIDELDLASVREVFEEMVKGNKISHAYLFTGPRGSGKTSGARVLARIVNCEKNAKQLGEPCNKCSECQTIFSGSAVDVIEIDAASNRGIDDIRELKERIKLSPAYLRKKVYIIDEVHMLTTEAFNALLKTLEEPPSHALFILCTTEAHKVPETISSRCVQVMFTKATTDEMERSLKRVVSGEKAKISKEALAKIAESVDGSFRDGVKIIDMALAKTKTIELSDVEKLMFGSVGYSVTSLVNAILAKEVGKAIEIFSKAMKEGMDISYLLVVTMKELREGVIARYGIGESKLEIGDVGEVVELIYALDEVARKVASSPVGEMLVEMAIVDWCAKGETPNRSDPEKTQKVNKPEKPKEERQSKPSSPIQEVVESAEEVEEEEGGEVWKKLLTGLNGDSYSLGALLAKARPGLIRGDTLAIEVGYDFHRQQLMNEKFRKRIEELVSKEVGRKMRIVCEVKEGKELQIEDKIDRMTEVSLEEAEDIFVN